MTREELQEAIRASWGADTSDDPAWSEENPTLGQCAVTTYVMREYLGGEILVAPVVPSDVNDHHLWLRLPSGEEIDFTFDQFTEGQTLGPAWVGEPTPDTLPRCELLLARVRERLGR
ncbi:MAG: hypothetical protein ACJ762_05870 [Solirubrobacteraceae bacterium]